MENPELIISTLDGYLDHSVRLVLYGRGGLYLSFPDSPVGWAKTHDVDGIIELSEWKDLEGDTQFWGAIERTNDQLSDKGLYITHLFGEEQVFLRRNWSDHIVPITSIATNHLQLFRPATIDLVLTKMMRGDDPQDLDDAKFLINRDQITRRNLVDAFAVSNLTDVAELHDAFERAKPHVLQFAIDSRADSE